MSVEIGESIAFKPKINIYKYIVIAVTCFLLLFLLYKFITSSVIKTDQVYFEVEKGMSVKDIVEKAEEDKIVRSQFFLYVLLTFFYDPTNIHAGQYVFHKNDDVFNVADKLASSEVSQELITLTLPEGYTVKDMARIGQKHLHDFDTERYLQLTSEKEGYMFPETYFVPKDFTAQDLFELQVETFFEKTNSLFTKQRSNDLTDEETVILASIIEREAKDEESMQMVAGVMINRINLGMPLQADASIEYILDKPLNELKPGVLAEILKTSDSLYNTYKNNGFPPTPIGNPGLNSLKAALNPTIHDFYYYLTDAEGNFYYAKTLSEHNSNVARYLR